MTKIDRIIELLETLAANNGHGEQLPGSLPRGCTLDSLLTPEQFCLWQSVGRAWFIARRKRLPGVIIHSREMVRVHPRTYLEKAVRK